MRELSLKQITALLDDIVGLLGVKILPSEKDSHSDAMLVLTEFVAQSYPNLHAAEIKAAYRLHAKGDLGVESYTLNPLQFGKVMKAYFDWKTIKMAKIVNGGLLEIEAPAALPTEAEYEAQVWQLIERSFEIVCNDKYYEDFGNVLYDFLDKKGVINLSVERKKQCYVEAIQQHERELRAKAERNVYRSKNEEYVPIGKIVEASKLLDKYIEKKIPDTEEGVLKAIAKRIAYHNFLTDCRIAGISIEDLKDGSTTEFIPDHQISQTNEPPRI